MPDGKLKDYLLSNFADIWREYINDQTSLSEEKNVDVMVEKVHTKRGKVIVHSDSVLSKGNNEISRSEDFDFDDSLRHCCLTLLPQATLFPLNLHCFLSIYIVASQSTLLPLNPLSCFSTLI